MAKSAASGIDNISVLFTCIGRRVSLMRSFREAAKQLKIELTILGTDTSELSPALRLCDERFIVKPVTHSSYINQLLKIVKANGVKLIVPTVDLDLKKLAKSKSKFAALGCRILVSTPQVVDICQDKRETYRFLSKNSFDSPVTISARTALSKKDMTWPCFLKPWDGYASRGNAVVKNRKELAFFAARIPNCIVQEYVSGVEYTCDVYVDLDMKIRCVVPRKRIEVRAGEVSKGQIAKNSHIMNEVVKVVERLGAGPGVVTLQLFMTENKKIKVIEINPRFGGGVPLSIKAGANFPKWILQELLGRQPRIGFDGFRDDLIMLRYDDEIWL